MTPVDLMRAILKAPVDLLYFGGIGTYVKASSESQRRRRRPRQRCAARRRRPRCAPRWSARAPISASPSAAASRRRWPARKINTDALDNSAGVDTSDHEVNIKIATGEAITRGALSREDRDALLFAHDRRGRGPGAAPQLPAEPGDQRRRGAGRRGARPAGALHARAGAPGPARPRRRVPARRRGDAHARPAPRST